MVALAAMVVLLMLMIGSVNAATLTVAAVNYRFEPDSQAVSAGDAVRWTFGGEPHTVTSGAPSAPDGRFDSGIKDPGGSFQVTFNSAGSFPYFCQIHPEEMHGIIVVQEVATASPTAKPTAAPTTSPTAAPTDKPAAAPTDAPTSAPTPFPSAPSSTASIQPASVAPISSPTDEPAVASPAPSRAVPPSPAQTPVPESADTAAAIDPAPIVGGAVIIGVLVAGGLAVARRSRRA